MAKATIRERLIKALEKRGETVIKITARRTIMTHNHVPHDDWFFYIGLAGSLRHGCTMAESVPVSDRFKKLLLSDATNA